MSLAAMQAIARELKKEEDRHKKKKEDLRKKKESAKRGFGMAFKR